MKLRHRLCTIALALIASVVSLCAQSTNPNTPEQLPEPKTSPSHNLRGLTVPDVPEYPEPAARDFFDPKYRVGFHVPAGWNFEKKDGVLSNYRVEMRPSRARADVRGVAVINFNPWPPTTFAGAIFYYSVTPYSSAAACAQQAVGRPNKAMLDVEIGPLSFRHGHDQRGKICTETRDEVFTAMRGGACLRFDLVVDTFCSATSGAMEINSFQLKDVETRLGGILDSVRIDGR